ncbi:MAG: MFS transporter [candidate division NC10 bacterium]|nr:MFS transporter [candidate division NC10 bacterium]
MAPPHPRAFETARVGLLSIGHAIHDMYPAFLAPLLPLLRAKLGLSNTLAGSLATFLRSSSLAQPLIGYLADRTSPRLFVILAPATTGLFMSLTGTVPSYGFVALLLFCAGLSHACYHAPAPAMIARVAGDRMGTGMSFFMTGGELGRALGPILIVLVVEWVGLEQGYLAAIPGILCSLLLTRQVGRVDRTARPGARVDLRPIFRERRGPLLLLLAFVWIRALMAGSLGVFTPTYLTTRDLSLAQAAAGYALLELAGAAGAMGGGTLSDRLGRKRTLILLQALAVPSFYAMAFAPHILIFPLLALSGLVILSATPVVVAMFQEWLPESRSLASGLYFGLNYIGTGAAAVLFGVVADQVGVRLAFHLLGLIPLVCIPLSFLLRDPPATASAGTH